MNAVVGFMTSAAVTSVFAWILTQIVVTATLYLSYRVLRTLTSDSSDRFFFLKCAMGVVLFLPLFTLPSGLELTRTGHEEVITTTVTNFAMERSYPSFEFLAFVPFICLVLYISFASRLLFQFFYSFFELNRIARKSTWYRSVNGIDVRLTEENMPPATFGILRPVIVIPVSSTTSLEESALDMIIQHEMTHIKRRDYLFNLLRALIRAALCFSPFAHRLSQAMVEEMELSCDAETIRHGGIDTKAYASMLIELATRSRSRTDLLHSGLFASHSFISRRIKSMKYVHGKTRKFVTVAVFAVTAMLTGPALSSLGITEAVESSIPARSGTGDIYAYSAHLRDNEGRQTSTAGSMKLIDGGSFQILVGAFSLDVKTEKVEDEWRFNSELFDASKTLVASASVISGGDSGAQINWGSDRKGDASQTFSAFTLNLSPTAGRSQKPISRSGKPSTPEKDQIRLNYKEPVSIKDMLKTIASISGKNVVLSRDVDVTTQLVAPTSTSKENAWLAVSNALNQAGLQVDESEKVIRISRK